MTKGGALHPYAPKEVKIAYTRVQEAEKVISNSPSMR